MPLWDPKSFREEDFARAASRNELVLGYEGADAVATMLLQNSDAIYWPDDPVGEALYLHKLAALPHVRGHGWSGRLISWAQSEAHAQGVRFLRLDTAPRAKLIALYERQGFVLIDLEPRYFGEVYAVRLELAL